MRKNRVAIGATLLVGLLALTIWAVQTRDKAPAEVAAESGIPEIDKDSITSMEITRPGEETVVLTKTGDEWRVTTPIESESDKNAVSGALNRLGDLESTGIVATKAENHERLEIGPAKAIKVVAKAGETVAATVYFGKYSGGKTMVRADDSDEVHGVRGSVRYVFDRELKNWRNRKVTDAKEKDVTTIEYNQGKAKLAFVRDDAGEWAQSKGQKAIKDFDPKKVTGFVSTAARLTASDFAKPTVTADKAGLDSPAATVTFVVQPKPEKKPTDGGVPDAGSVAAEAPPAQTITLRIGGKAEGEAQFYLKRDDADAIYVVSKYLAERLQPTREKFEKSKAPPPSAMPAAPPPPGGQGTPQLPPEVMKQLQEQLKAQGKHP